MSTVLEKIRDDFAARVKRLSYEFPRERRRKEYQARKQNALTDFAKKFVLYGDREHRDYATMAKLWEKEQFTSRWPPTINQFAYLGGVRAVYRRIVEGGLGIDERLGPWNGGFFRGLKMAGALRPYGKRQWAIWENSHRELVQDMEEMGVFNRMESKTGRNGIRRLRRCPASFLPAEPLDGDSVVAGLFAGSATREVEHEEWIEMPESKEIIQLLDGWGILWKPGFMFRGRGTILVPPFYAPLFIDITPPRSTARMLALGRSAMCPILPAIYWDLTLRKEYLPVIPFKNALPYSCSMRTFRRRGWKRTELHLMAVRMGINGVDSRLRRRMAAWYEAQVKLKAGGGSMVNDAASPDVAAPGIAHEPARIGPGTEIPIPETPS